MLKNKSGGFTLIEVTMVLAITAAMVAMIFSGQTAVRADTEFTTTVNSVVTGLEAARNSAITSQNLGSGAAGKDQTRIIYGVLVSAHTGDNFITVTDIVGTTTPPIYQTSDCAILGTDAAEDLSSGQSYTIPLNWGVTVQNSGANDTYVVFHRLLCGGSLMTYDFSADPGTAYNQLAYSEAPTAGATVQFGLKGTNGRTAKITIDGAHNAAITEQIQ